MNVGQKWTIIGLISIAAAIALLLYNISTFQEPQEILRMCDEHYQEQIQEICIQPLVNRNQIQQFNESIVWQEYIRNQAKE